MKFSIDDELFRVSQRRQPTWMMSYVFEWLNGPDNGNYGFTVGLSVDWSDPRAQRTPEQLMDEARGFIEGFYEPGGIGRQTFLTTFQLAPAGRAINRRSALWDGTGGP